MHALSQRRPRAPTEGEAVVATKLVTTCRAVEAGFALVERRTPDTRLAVAARSAGAFVASIRARLGDRPAAAPLRDRLRLEWLASSVSPGRADVRLLEECAHLLADGLRDVPTDGLYAGEIARLRVAQAEAYSLGRAVAAENADLLFALA